MSAGTYTLLIELPVPRSITFGAAGVRELEAGWYAYTGSALGPGGFRRVERHREIASGERETRHWHVDYLLGEGSSSLDAVWTTEGSEAECEIAASIGGEAIPGIGASDCTCDTHLRFGRRRADLAKRIARAHR
ncbi:MAG: DUF123 domain-containing protein [Halodesulfurarchaeum sp.]